MQVGVESRDDGVGLLNSKPYWSLGDRTRVF